MLNLNLIDHNTLLTVEVIALMVLLAFGAWRLSRQRGASADTGELNYDMRRDGPRLEA